VIDHELDSTDSFFGNFILVGFTALFIMLICSMCSAISEQEDKFNKECKKHGGETYTI
jgi:hypothetical protein